MSADDELTARLRDADPAASLPSATPTEVARLLEDAMTEQTGSASRGPLSWLVAAAAAVVVLGGVGAVALTGDDGGTPPSAGPTSSGGEEPTVTTLAARASSDARCMVPSAEVLSGKPVAFSGTVESTDAGTVTLVPDRWYAGDETDLVEVQGPSERMSILLESVAFEDGERYLVAADASGDVMACGFSAAYSTELAKVYEEAFPS